MSEQLPYLAGTTPGGASETTEEPAPNEHVRVLEDFFRRVCRPPTVATSVSEVLTREAEALQGGIERRDAGAATMVRLNAPLPAQRPSADDLFSADLSRDVLYQTTMCLTISSGHPHEAGVQAEIVATLLDAGAKINGLNDDGMPLATALAFGYQETADLLVGRGARVDNVVLAAGLGRIDLLRALIDDQGRLIGDQCYVDPFGLTIESSQELQDRAFFAACKLGHHDAASLLIDAGANHNFAPQRNEAALHWAAYHGHLPVVQLMVEAGADTSLEDDQWHCKPIVWAKKGGQDSIVEYLSSHTKDRGHQA